MYLAIATGLVVSLFFCDVATVVGPQGESAGIPYREYLPYLILMIVGSAANLVALFSFKHRMFQLRITAAAFVVLLGLQGWLIYKYFTSADGIVFAVTAVFPVVAAVFDILAVRGIFADELMVRNAGRLRSAKRNFSK